jgi:hypothetical protein
MNSAASHGLQLHTAEWVVRRSDHRGTVYQCAATWASGAACREYRFAINDIPVGGVHYRITAAQPNQRRDCGRTT